jgi:hypothetical protein
MRGIDFVRGSLGVGIGPADGGDAGAVVCQTDGDRMTDPPSRSSYDRDLIFESQHGCTLKAHVQRVNQDGWLCEVRI